MPDGSFPTPITPPLHHSGVVVHGEKVGRTIGFPTANIAQAPTTDELKPGVYFGKCQAIDSESKEEPAFYDCLAYFGPRYIFGEEVNSFEVFIYDFNQDLYGKTISVLLSHYQRPPQKVSSLDQLRQLLERDKLVGETLRQPKS
jgi:riboflavin kinase / FMN adenylyltransferase